MIKIQPERGNNMEMEQPVYFSRILDPGSKRSREMAVSLDQIEKVNELMHILDYHFHCLETSNIKDQLYSIIKKPDVKIPLDSLYSFLSTFHKTR